MKDRLLPPIDSETAPNSDNFSGSEALADTLSGLGCKTGQGYLYAQPMTADEAFNFAQNSLGPTPG